MNYLNVCSGGELFTFSLAMPDLQAGSNTHFQKLTHQKIISYKPSSHLEQVSCYLKLLKPPDQPLYHIILVVFHTALFLNKQVN